MAERAALFMSNAEATQLAWRSGGRSRTGTLAELLAVPDLDARVWLLDGRRVLLAEAELPPGNRRVQEQALPFALEDQILTPVDDLAFATHRLSATRLAAAVFDAAELDARLEALAAAGLQTDQCVPDILCVPWFESTWTLLFDGEDAWLRTGPYAGARFEAAQWQTFLAQALVGVDGERHLRVHGASEARLAEIAALSPALIVDPASRAGAVDLLATFAAGHAQGHVIDLLAALPRRRQAHVGSARRWWWATAALVLVAALAHAGFLQWRVAALETQRAAEIARTEALFREMFPQVTRIEDVRAQATQALAAAAASARRGRPFLDLLAAAGQGLAQQGGLHFESASYGNGALELRVRAEDMAALERYQQTLAASALPVQLLSIENRDAAAVGLLRVGQTP
ncbi:MAG TPA: type II secretion system protein GspL [Gammaproteobacteria bacterium]|nr:type II secretion system protein GspL [Gammaproteobacteria bacterium]